MCGITGSEDAGGRAPLRAYAVSAWALGGSPVRLLGGCGVKLPAGGGSVQRGRVFDLVDLLAFFSGRNFKVGAAHIPCFGFFDFRFEKPVGNLWSACCPHIVHRSFGFKGKPPTSYLTPTNFAFLVLRLPGLKIIVSVPGCSYDIKNCN